MTKGSSISGAKLDWFRVLCAVLVVEIHTQPLEKIFPVGDLVLTRMIARIAVPFFFLVSGYFLREKLERGRLERTVRKLGLLYLGAVALYLPLNLYMGQHRGLTVGALVRDLVLDGTFYHLWYFPAASLPFKGSCLMSWACSRSFVPVSLKVCPSWAPAPA